MTSEIRTGLVLRIESKEPAETQLVIFHHAAGTRFSYLNWTKFVSLTTELLIVDLPGRENPKDILRQDPDTLFSALGLELNKYLNLPFIFFGHSLGGWVALGVMKQLCIFPSLFVVSAIPPPTNKRPSAFLHLKSDQELISHLKYLGGTSGELSQNEEFREWIIALYRLDLNLMNAISIPKCIFPVPILALGGHSDPLTSSEELLLWKDWTNQSFDLQFFAGEHFYCFNHTEAMIQMIELTRKKLR